MRSNAFASAPAGAIILVTLAVALGGCIGSVDREAGPVEPGNDSLEGLGGSDEEKANDEGRARNASVEPQLYPWIDGLVLEQARFDIRYVPEETIDAEGTLRVSNPSPGAREQLVFSLSPLEITSIENDEGDELNYSVDPGLPVPIEPGYQTVIDVTVELEEPLASGDQRTLHAAYEGWFDELYRTPSGPPHEFTANYHALLTPAVHSQGHIPLPGDVLVNLTYPQEWTLAPGATPVGEPEEDAQAGDGWRTTRYETSGGRVPLYSAKGMEYLEDHVNGTLVRTYYFPDTQANAPALQASAVQAVEVVSDLTGEYPHGHISTVPYPTWTAYVKNELTLLGPHFYRGAQEHVPAQSGRPTPTLAGDRGMEEVVVHEHAHQWWGVNVHGANYNASEGTYDGWLTEGFTTYLSEIVYYERAYGNDTAAQKARARMLDQKAEAGALGERPLTEAPSGQQDYHRTAMMMRALRAYGIALDKPDAVFTALERIQEMRGASAGGIGAISTEGIVDQFESALGQELDKVVDPWLYTTDVPELVIEDVERGGSNLTVTIANPSPVRTAAHVRVDLADGGSQEAWQVAPAESTATVELAASGGPAPVERVVVDPDYHVYESDETNNVWIPGAGPVS